MGSQKIAEWVRPEIVRPIAGATAAERAEELRTIAEDVLNEDLRIALLRVAEVYDRMARGVRSGWPYQHGEHRQIA